MPGWIAALFVAVWSTGALVLARVVVEDVRALRRPADPGGEVRVRISDVVVRTGEEEVVLGLADAPRSPRVRAAGVRVHRLIEARAAIARLRPRDARRFVLEAAAIEEAARDGTWSDPDEPDAPRPRVHVWLLRDQPLPRLAGIYASERRLLAALEGDRAEPWVFALPTYRDVAGGWRVEISPGAPQPWTRPPVPRDT